jgi:hypothetical protein
MGSGSRREELLMPLDSERYQIREMSSDWIRADREALAVMAAPCKSLAEKSISYPATFRPPSGGAGTLLHRRGLAATSLPPRLESPAVALSPIRRAC